MGLLPVVAIAVAKEKVAVVLPPVRGIIIPMEIGYLLTQERTPCLEVGETPILQEEADLENPSEGRRKDRSNSVPVVLFIMGEPGYAGERHRAILSGGWMEQDEQKKRNRPIPVVSQNVATKKNTLTGSTKRNRMVIKKSSKAKAKEVKIGKWSFGNIFRIILIVCVIVAVVLLIGSQTYSVKKSMK